MKLPPLSPGVSVRRSASPATWWGHVGVSPSSESKTGGLLCIDSSPCLDKSGRKQRAKCCTNKDCDDNSFTCP